MDETPFASTDDVAARWRILSDTETQLAGTLIEDASDMIRSRWSDVDARVTAGTLSENSLVRVVSAMVKRAMVNPSDGVESSGQTAGPFGATVKFTNPNGNLYLNADEVRILAGDYGTRRSLVGWLA